MGYCPLCVQGSLGLAPCTPPVPHLFAWDTLLGQQSLGVVGYVLAGSFKVYGIFLLLLVLLAQVKLSVNTN